MRVERARENIFTVTATSQELSALVAAARMEPRSDARGARAATREAIEVLKRVLSGFDRARQRPMEAGG